VTLLDITFKKVLESLCGSSTDNVAVLRDFSITTDMKHTALLRSFLMASPRDPRISDRTGYVTALLNVSSIP